jgi:glucose-6-phosphate 1-epimerase
LSGVEVLTSTAPDGAELDVSPHGAQVLGWRPASGGERLWLSSLAAPPSLRGGIPVVFPQFADRGPLPKHGFARDRTWEVVAVAGGRAMLRLVDDRATRQLWPHAFSAVLTAEAVAERLEVDLTVANTGDAALTFAAALHSYLAVADAAGTSVAGVGGHPAEDNGRGGAVVALPAEDLRVRPPLDLAVRGAAGPRRLRGGAYGDLVLTTGGFTDTVVWNPGADHPADVADDEVAGFVCVEPAALAPITLEPGATWRGSMRLRAVASGEVRIDDPNGVQPG